MERIIRRFPVIVLAVFFFICGCNSSGKDTFIDSGETQKIKNAVVRYNQLLSDGYKNLNMNPMQEVTTIEQAEKLYFHMSALGEAEIRMLSEVKNIEFSKIALEKPGKAIVKTKEIWDFTHVDIKSNKKLYEEKDFYYYMTYEIQKKGDRWLIDKVTALLNDRPSSENKKIHPRLDKTLKK